jgi:hypothetical protein
MLKLWRFSCRISLTPVQSMGKHNSYVSTVASRYLTIIRMGDVDIRFPRECIDVLRSRPFAFSARRCNKFAVGRVILAGDSAHVFPPCKYPPEVFASRKVLMNCSWWPGNFLWIQRLIWLGMAPCNCHPRKFKELRAADFWLV